MKQNDGCALEMQLNGCWVPLAIRYRQLNTIEMRLLARGETIINDAKAIRRHDWRERQALALIFKG